VELVTRAAGIVYLCHAFSFPPRNPYGGKQPRFMAQPALLPRGVFDPVLSLSPVQIAIRQAFGLTF
jgi:hypothetical protein